MACPGLHGFLSSLLYLRAAGSFSCLVWVSWHSSCLRLPHHTIGSTIALQCLSHVKGSSALKWQRWTKASGESGGVPPWTWCLYFLAPLLPLVFPPSLPNHLLWPQVYLWVLIFFLGSHTWHWVWGHQLCSSLPPLEPRPSNLERKPFGKREDSTKVQMHF